MRRLVLLVGVTVGVSLALLCGTDAWAAKKGRKGPPVLLIQPGTARPGDVVSVTVVTPPAQLVSGGTIGGRTLRFYPVAGGFRALTPISVDQKPGTLDIEVQTFVPRGGKKAPQRVDRFASIDVVDPKFPRRELKVAKKFTEPTPKIRKQMAEDRVAFKRAYAQRDGPPLFSTPFAWPRQAALTAPFGDLRTFNGVKASQHLGIDLQGQIGEPIYASNDGTVVLDRDAHASGRTVLLHHGARLFTAYFHMSAVEVKDGQKVKRGQRLGKVGMSGRVTGPHLHFAVKLDGVYIDPMSLLRLRF